MPIVYLIINKDSGKVYVGKTIHDLAFRWTDHKRKAVTGYRSRYLHNSIAKRGVDKFDACVIDEAETNKQVQRLEEHYIRVYRSSEKEFGYNLTLGGEGEVPNAETREKLREATNR